MKKNIRPLSRSEIMARIKSKDTNPEMIVRKLVYHQGFRFRLHRKDLPGVPDLAFILKKKVIFVNGCFWHQHQGCKISHLPKSNTEYWHNKLAKTLDRDKKNQISLTETSWKILIIWECETKQTAMLLKKINKFLSD